MITSCSILALTIIYAGFILWCHRGWKSIEVANKKANSKLLNVDVVVAIRNEEDTILNLLERLVIQNYPKSNFRIVVIDDHSDDDSFTTASNFLSHHAEINSMILHSEGQGKKAALAQAIKNSAADLILTTDADCLVQDGWIRSMAEPFSRPEISFVAGPVVLSGGKGLFSLMQKMEMIGLTGIAGASIANRRAMMCNGANLCYRKSAYDAVQGYLGSEFASGDDTQLMRKIHSEDPRKLLFVKSKKAIVQSHSLSNLKYFWQQRRRWATKIPFTLSFFTVFIAVVSWLVHAGLFLLLIALVFYPENTPLFLAAIIIKMTSELLFLKNVGKDLDQQIQSFSVVLIQPLYWLYISLIGLAVPFSSYEWKGRKVK